MRKALANGGGNSLYNLDIPMVKDLQPDVVLTQSLCDVCSIDLVTVERVIMEMKSPARVLDLNPKTLGEILLDITRIGEVIGCEEGALAVTTQLAARIERVKKKMMRQLKKIPNVSFFEWTDPVFVGGHWTPEMIILAGGTHPLNPPGKKSTGVLDESITQSDPDMIIIAPCGMNLAKTRQLVEIMERDPKRGEWFRALRAFQCKKVVLVDGNEMFNRPGPRLVDALEFCAALTDAYQSLSEIQPFETSQVPFDFPWSPL